jgi:hypothetical protein
MKLLKRSITREELGQIAKRRFGNIVKAVVDIQKEIMVIDAELHADQEALLLEQGSSQEDLWGINLYPELKDEDFIDFDSMINLRPSAGNLTRNVGDPQMRKTIVSVVRKWIKE